MRCEFFVGVLCRLRWALACCGVSLLGCWCFLCCYELITNVINTQQIDFQGVTRVMAGVGGLAGFDSVWCKHPFFEKNFFKKKIFKIKKMRVYCHVYARVCTRICVSLYIKYIIYIVLSLYLLRISY